MAQKPKQPHLPFLDWMRGLAAAVMLQGHTFDSFERHDLRDQSAFVLSQFFGGLAPAIFLALTGVTFAFLMERNERRGVPMFDRWIEALKRARYLLLIAVLFRLQLWVFSWGKSDWHDLFKVDVLNLMGVSMLLLSPLALLPLAERARAATVIGLLIACAAPLMSVANLTWMHPFVAAYLTPSYATFAIFPWGAFIAFGLAAGTMLKACRPEHLDRFMQWSAILGFGLVVGGQYFANLPYSLYEKSEFWLNSPALVLIKLGLVLLVGAFAFLWSARSWGPTWSWLRQLGTASLLVYWVHIELVYGRWFGSSKGTLDTWGCVLASAAMMSAMVALACAKSWLTEARLTEAARRIPSVRREQPERERATLQATGASSGK
jgi:peptidoglycan/LPS O-acetylase OafA/YrhL